ncbi:MAG: 50S ribosomal protein L28 [Candidatus Kerfeldbacteria bacterium CG08_land_8_20_14_0_20_42_7]|uniref:50S ribosomal protein L28 n=1 Tax=Candidatus Kerfeldbacteria bacterium CG08_land_8_20_14_0_20_42_7 TaxID=2014245 RepID=A0A2H0YTZ7_9BACT|nr:MAG: 50S ribosomal protein L28 [Candidatus Kerfeldbacteria bacterium CG08_land_8_20_14_0_20_42_7]
MARTCELCGRGSLKSMSRSHSHIGTIKKQKVNLQSLLVNGKRRQACTNCIRTATKRLKATVKQQKATK